MKRIFFLCLVVLAFSCTDNNKIPSDIIPQQKMQKLLWDMVQADRFNNYFVITVLDSSKIDSAVFRLYDEVFQLHHTNKEEFLRSYKFYEGRPDLAKIMFDSIALKSERRRADVHKNRSRDSMVKKIVNPGHAVKDSSAKIERPTQPHYE
ncbi:MAG: DUF4296 domain-containing protein [Flavitalea sp.]